MNKSMNKKRVSKSKAVDLIKASKGRFFTVTFVKKNGEERTINCNTSITNTNPSALGNLTVYSMKDKAIKSLRLNSIKSVVMNNIIYKVS